MSNQDSLHDFYSSIDKLNSLSLNLSKAYEHFNNQILYLSDQDKYYLEVIEYASDELMRIRELKKTICYFLQIVL